MQQRRGHLREIVEDTLAEDATTFTFSYIYDNRELAILLNRLRYHTALRSLDLSYNIPFTVQNYHRIALLTQLTSLTLERIEMKNEDLQTLSNQIYLKHLVLADNRLSGAAANQLTRLTNLTELDLSRNPLSDASVVAACKLPKLKTLIYNDNVINTRSLRAFGRSKSLMSLSLIHCNFRHFQEMRLMAQSTTLQSLDMSQIHLTAAALSPLTQLRQLTSLTLQNCSLREEEFDVLAQFSSLRKLNVKANDVSTVTALTKLNHLSTLNLAANNMLTVSAADFLAMTALTDLKLHGYPNFNDILIALTPHPTLRALSLYGCEILATGAKAIASMTRILSLNVNHNLIGREGALALVRSSHLTKLKMLNCGEGNLEVLPLNWYEDQVINPFIATNFSLLTLKYTDLEMPDPVMQTLEGNKRLVCLVNALNQLAQRPRFSAVDDEQIISLSAEAVNFLLVMLPYLNQSQSAVTMQAILTTAHRNLLFSVLAKFQFSNFSACRQQANLVQSLLLSVPEGCDHYLAARTEAFLFSYPFYCASLPHVQAFLESLMILIDSAGKFIPLQQDGLRELDGILLSLLELPNSTHAILKEEERHCYLQYFLLSVCLSSDPRLQSRADRFGLFVDQAYLKTMHSFRQAFAAIPKNSEMLHHQNTLQTLLDQFCCDPTCLNRQDANFKILATILRRPQKRTHTNENLVDQLVMKRNKP